MIKKIVIIFITILAINSTYAAYTNNENYTNLFLESNGWCANLEITFKVWNETDYNNKKEIEDDLCEAGCEEDCDWDDEPDCVKCKRGCTEFNYIKGATIKIYDGPLDSLTNLVNTTVNDTGHFTYTFDKAQQHLIEIFPKDKTNYNDFHQIYDLYECGHAQETTIKKEVEKNTPPTPKDRTFLYEEQEVELIVKQTITNKSTDFSIDQSIKMPKELENTIKHFELTANTANFSAIAIKIKVDNLTSQYTTTKVQRYNPSTKKWEEDSYENLQNQISFDATKLGIYAITQTIDREAQAIAKEEAAALIKETETEENVDLDLTTNTNTTTSNKNLIIGLSVGACVILLIIILIAKKKNTGHNEENIHPDHQDKLVLTTYEATYQQAKKYTQEHKGKYLKDALYRALESANVPKDIIDKVFNEEY